MLLAAVEPADGVAAVGPEPLVEQLRRRPQQLGRRARADQRQPEDPALGPHLRGVRRHLVGQALRHPRLQRLLGVLQAQRPTETHLPVGLAETFN